MIAMAQAPVYDIAVKGWPETNTLGDCPFCHRALLTLEEKAVPYQKTLIDFEAKPAWLLDVNPAGSVPVMKDLASGEWIVDSGVIVDLLEAKFPEPALGTAESAPQVGGDVFPAFRDFIKSSDAEEAEKEAALVAALTALNEHLAASGPFVGGESVTATDCSLMPKLYHMKVATKHFKGWEMPASLSAVAAYMDAFMARDSWKATHYSPELVVKGWERHGVARKANL